MNGKRGEIGLRPGVGEEGAKMRIAYLLMLTASLAAGSAEATCRTDMRESSPVSRFTPHNGGATLVDSETGLEWKRCPEGAVFADNGTPGNIADDQCVLGGGTATFTWQQALQRAEAVDTALGQTSPNGLPGEGGYAGSSDWRVPNAKELTSIVEDACYSPALNLTLFPFPFGGLHTFWTSTPYAGGASIVDGAWVVDFFTGDTGSTFEFGKTNSYLLQLVRSGL